MMCVFNILFLCLFKFAIILKYNTIWSWEKQLYMYYYLHKNVPKELISPEAKLPQQNA